MTPPLGIETLTGPSLVTEEYDYPLVTVEIDFHQSVTSTEVVVHVMVVEKTTLTYFKQLQSGSYTSVHMFTTVSTSLAYTNVPTIVMSTSLSYIGVPTSTIVSTLVSYTRVLPTVSTLQAHTSVSTAVSTSISYLSVTRPTTVVTNSTLLLHTTTMRRDSAISTSSLTVARQAETGIIVIAVPVALVVIIIIIMTVTLVIIFTWWRRRSHKNTHSVQYPAVTTSDEIVELQQNACYMTTNNEKDKQQDYEIANYKQIAIQPNTSYVTYNNKNSKLHVHNCIPDEHEYTVPSLVSTPNVSHTNTTDDPISLQQNVSYITTTPNKPDNESEADHDDRSNVYTYAAVGPRYKLNPVAPAMVQNLAYGTSSSCSS